MGKLDSAVGFKCSRSFISDSCNGMRDLSRVVVEEKVTWAYGCVTHCMKNIGEGLCRECIAPVIKQPLLVAKTVRGTNMIRKIFESLCIDKLTMVYGFVLYSKKRWSSINSTLQRLLRFIEVIVYLAPACLYQSENLTIDHTFQLPPVLTEIIS